MNLYRRVNNIAGWVVFLVAAAVYIITSEPTMSYWDCGEYIATAYKLEVGHAPGAPLFQIIGRFFSLFAFGDQALVARMINTMSALSSAFTILFLFWTITMIAKKILFRNGGEMDRDRMITIIGAGAVGALAYTFTDSFWFSAVEGEVYAMSSFFTALVFWVILKWDERADEPHSIRYLVLIAYLMGLSIGVHLLNLLAIPAITFVYYFRKYENHNWKKLLLVTVAGVLILALVMYIIIPWVVQLAGWFERFFVNSLGLPFNSGTIFYFVILIGGLIWGIIYTSRRSKPVWNAVVLSVTFLIIGYTSFLMLVIRSNANTPIDENNPENAMYLLSYLNREQYGDWPLLKGPYYNAPVIDRKSGNPVFSKDTVSGKYVVIDKKEFSEPVYDPRFTTIFPRMWCNYDQRYIDDYKTWGDVKGVPVTVNNGNESETIYKPTFSENLHFFWSYQVVHMYWRYFMWNFTGRQNDAQGYGSKVDGNWKSGIAFIDKSRLGRQDIPEMRKSKAANYFYFLPLILGLIGLWFTIRKDYRQALIIGLLFIMTGLAIIIYLNQYSPQPRERDYAYAGSFYAFAIWIGLSVPQIALWINSRLKGGLVVALAAGAAAVILLATGGWNDHDRSGKYSALATAKNYLNSCAPNAILFTNGDNDTFPLWYAQEVEGIRTDVRVVNLSLLNTDWYINQMKRKAYDGQPVPFTLPEELYRQGSHDITYIIDDPNIKEYVNLKDLFHLLKTDESRLKYPTERSGQVDFFPTSKFIVKTDSASIVDNHLIPSRYFSHLEDVRFDLKTQVVEKNTLMFLDLLAYNDWKRPVYLVMTMGPESYYGLDPYLHLEGLAYRLVPAKGVPQEGQTGSVTTDVMYDNMMNKFDWGNMQNPDIYLDEQSQRMLMNYRSLFGRLANALISEGRNDKAKKVIRRCLEIAPDEIMPFNYFITPVIEACYRMGDSSEGERIFAKTYTNVTEDLDYLYSFGRKDYAWMSVSFQEDLMTLQQLAEIAQKYSVTKYQKDSEEKFNEYYQRFINEVYQK